MADDLRLILCLILDKLVLDVWLISNDTTVDLKLGRSVMMIVVLNCVMCIDATVDLKLG